MEKPPLWQMKIATTKSKREYLQLMEEICETGYAARRERT
jgi:hypothetical protein